LLAILPANVGAADLAWRMALCGLGFGLFQSPNNRAIVAAAPRHRSGGAAGMLGTSRLLGQTLGASLAALLFSLSSHGTTLALVVATAIAAAASAVSWLRVIPVKSEP
jgi:DHA2 family multidrug resistance protein-like MFS transporter